MEKNNRPGTGRPVDQTLAAMEEMDVYCSEHPWSPAAVRRPQLSIRGRTFVALMGPSIEEGIAGFGDSVSAALRAFNAQYLRVHVRPKEWAGLIRQAAARSPNQ